MFSFVDLKSSSLFLDCFLTCGAIAEQKPPKIVSLAISSLKWKDLKRWKVLFCFYVACIKREY